MRYRSDYQETHDIDWFFIYKGKAYHAASNGGRLPDAIDSRNNRVLQERLEDIERHFDVEYAENLSDYHGQEEDLSSFDEYAAKGFISLDRTDNDESGENDKCRYHVVAFPKDGTIDDEEILQLLPELKEKDIKIDGLTQGTHELHE